MKKYFGIGLVLAAVGVGAWGYFCYFQNGFLTGINSEMDATTAMFDAINDKKPRVMSAAKKAGADVNHETPDGVTPLFMAVLSQDPKVVEKLIELGADVNKHNVNNWSALAMAVLNNENPDVIKLLVKAGANPYYRFENGMSFWRWLCLPIVLW